VPLSCNQSKGDRTAAEFGHPEVQERVRRPLRAAAHTQAGKTATLTGLANIAPVEVTCGFVTKLDRQAMGLPKTHYYDAVAIAGRGEPVAPLPWYEAMRAVAKGAYRQRKGGRSHQVASLPREVFGFRQWDQVRLSDGRVGFVKGRRSRGCFAISNLDGQLVAEAGYRRLQLLARAASLLVERRAILA
jgi:hypothetical protein